MLGREGKRRRMMELKELIRYFQTELDAAEGDSPQVTVERGPMHDALSFLYELEDRRGG
jgi:hypothetical protein